MESKNYRKVLGTFMCIYFGAVILNLCLNNLMSITSSCWFLHPIKEIIFDGIYIAALLMLLFNREKILTPPGKIGAWILIGVKGAYFLSSVLNLAEIYFFNYFYAWIIFLLISYTGLALLLFSTRIWMIIKILAVTPVVFALIYRAIIQIFYQSSYSYDSMVNLNIIGGVYSVIEFMFIGGVLVLSIIWMTRQPKALPQ